MGYRALLFCPDEKIARTVTQVLSELEFDVDSCIEPFAAVKKLMAEHFDAVVVDCDNDQNATLLFKSARNSAINQTSLAVAVVEGQAGVAKAFRIGANLVLTKPINVEQAKGTLRVARGLLRKGEAAKPSVPASASTPAPAIPRAVNPAPTTPARPATLAAASAARAREAATLISKPAPAAQAKPEDQPVLPATANAISTPSSEAAIESGGTRPASKSAHPAYTADTTAVVPPTLKAAHVDIGSPASGSGAASAAAPAREAGAPVVETAAPSPSRPAAASGPMSEATVTYSNPADPKTHESASAPPPAFTFGGANLPEKSESGGNKKVFLAIAAAVLLAAALYFGWTQMQGKSSAPAVISNPALPAKTKVPASTQPAQVQAGPVQPPGPPASAGSASGVQTALTPSQAADSQPTNSDAAGDESETDDAAPIASKPKPSSPSASNRPASKTAPTSKSGVQPAAQPTVAQQSVAPAIVAPAIVMKNGTIKSSAKAAPPDTAPPMDALATAGSDGSLSNLTAGSDTAKPILQSLTISQGVSQGLLLKKVQPAYPPTALRMRTEGAVKLLATIGKTGSVSNVKILSGEPLLAHSAVDAVKQWKYKPYLLNGDPVEIQTEVTINFKMPN